MPAPDTAPNDQPLTLAEIEKDNDPLFVLAQRVITHLEGEWRVRAILSHEVVLLGPDDMKFCFTPYGTGDYDPRQFYLDTFTATGRPRNKLEQRSVFTLPSQIADHLRVKLIPEARRRAEVNAKARAERQSTNDRRKDRIELIASQLEWNSSSYKCHSRNPYPSLDPRIGRRRRGSPPLLNGEIHYNDDGTMSTYLTGLPEALVDQIVNLVAAHFLPGPEQPEPSGTDK